MHHTTNHVIQSTAMAYLPTFSESNAWDPRLLMTGISENIPATSEALLMVFWRLLNITENVQRCPDNDYDFSLFIMCLRTIKKKKKKRTISVDLWVRCEKLSLMREINVFSPQAWDIMHECRQVQHGLRSQIVTLCHKTNTVSLSTVFPKLLKKLKLKCLKRSVYRNSIILRRFCMDISSL